MHDCRVDHPGKQAIVGNAIALTPPPPAGAGSVLSRAALAFVGELPSRFGAARTALLARRRARDAEIAAGKSYGFLAETESVRKGDWKVAATPSDLQK